MLRTDFEIIDWIVGLTSIVEFLDLYFAVKNINCWQKHDKYLPATACDPKKLYGRYFFFHRRGRRNRTESTLAKM